MNFEDNEAELLKHLRKEAYDIKQCFTTYTFQGLAIVAPTLGVVFKYLKEDPAIGFVGIPLVLLLIAIASIGAHKYSNANRIAGFDLYLQRVSRYPTAGCPGWHPHMRSMGWEEGLRAWRIFQATVFEFIYVHGNLQDALPQPHFQRRMRKMFRGVVLFWRVDRLKEPLVASSGRKISEGVGRGGDNPKEGKEWWFMTRSHLKKNGMSYYPGGYVIVLLKLIYITAAICLAVAFVAGLRVSASLSENSPSVTTSGLILGSWLAFFLFAYWVVARFFHIYARRKVFEEGLLSINSCAVLWQVIACAHFWTLHDLSVQGAEFQSYAKYSEKLAEKAIAFCDQIDNLYKWYESVPIHLMQEDPHGCLRANAS